MGWTTPNAARATGYLVTAGNWNELALDLQYLKGQAGTVAIEAGASFAGALSTSTDDPINHNGRGQISAFASGGTRLLADFGVNFYLTSGAAQSKRTSSIGGWIWRLDGNATDGSSVADLNYSPAGGTTLVRALRAVGRASGGPGIYIGDTASPGDPGANNVRVQGNVKAGGTQAIVALIGEGATYGVVRAMNNAESAYEDLVLRGDDLVVELGSAGSVTERLRLDDAGKITLVGTAAGGLAPRTTVPAPFMYTAGTAGTWAEAALEATDTAITTETRKFDASSDEKVEFPLEVPTNYAGGSITVKPKWFANATSGACRWSLQVTNVASGGAMNGAPSERVVGNFTTDGTANEENVSTLTWSSSLPAAGDSLFVRFVRDADNAGDTLAVDAELIDIVFEFGS